MRFPIWVVAAVPLVLGGCYGQKMLRQPITVDETAQDTQVIRQQQAALEQRISELEKRAEEQATLLRGMKADESTRWEDLDARLLAIDSKLRDALGSRSGYSQPSGSRYWTNPPVQRPGTPTSPDTGAATVGSTGGFTGSAGGSGADTSGTAADTTAQARNVPSEAEAKRIYDQAYLDYNRGNYSLAVLGFREYLRRSPQAELADNAQYWIGECFYAQRDFGAAVQEFQKVVDQYPRGNKVPAALLKIGYCYLQLGDKTSARRYLRQVVDQFPHSEEAGTARNKLRSAGLE